MNSIYFKILLLGAILGLPSSLFLSNAEAEPYASPSQAATTPVSPAVPQAKDATGGGLINFEAVLVDAPKKAAKKAATVEVKVTGISLVDPDSVGEKPAPGQGHLHFKLDGNPVIATTATKLSFHDLASGTHKITVILAANDHSPIGRENTLTVTIP